MQYFRPRCGASRVPLRSDRTGEQVPEPEPPEKANRELLGVSFLLSTQCTPGPHTSHTPLPFTIVRSQEAEARSARRPHALRAGHGTL